MYNCTIQFEAIRSLIAGVNSGETVEIKVTLTEFDLTPAATGNVNMTLSGLQSSVEYYQEDSWSVGITNKGKMTLPLQAETDLTDDAIEMFLRSTSNSQSFTITNIDKSDVEIEVQRKGDWSQNRRAVTFIGEFDYNFTIRRVNEE